MIRLIAALAILALADGPDLALSKAPVAYFPPSLAKTAVKCSFSRRDNGEPILSAFENKWYSSQLAAAQEPSLHRASTDSPSTNSIRFTWLRTFHPAVFVRIEQLDTPTPRLTAKQLSGAGGYDPGRIARQISRPLTHAEAGKLFSLITRTKLLQEAPKDCSMGCDGAQWLFESTNGGRYHFISRWSPTKGASREVGLALLALTGWQFADVY